MRMEEGPIRESEMLQLNNEASMDPRNNAVSRYQQDGVASYVNMRGVNDQPQSGVAIQLDPSVLKQEFNRAERSRHDVNAALQAQAADAIQYQEAKAQGYTGPQHQIGIPDKYKVNVGNAIGITGRLPFANGLAELYGSANGKGDVSRGVAINHGPISAFAERGEGAYALTGQDTIKAGVKYTNGPHSLVLDHNQSTNAPRDQNNTRLGYNYKF